MKKNRISLLLLLCFITAFHSQQLYAKEYYLETWECFLDLPQGITPVEITGDKATFGDENETVFFQIKVYPPGSYDSAGDMFRDIKEKIKADGEGAPFVYQDKDAHFGDLSFNIGPVSYKGYSVMINSSDRDWVILSFCETEVYDAFHFNLLSAIDSFSIDIPALYKPGPVSAFYETSFDKPAPVTISVPFENGRIDIEADANAIEASEVTAEREAWVLSQFSAEDTDAWSRFYRMIYRDNFEKIEALSDRVSRMLAPGTGGTGGGRLTDTDISARLLSWLQDFSYARTGTIADFSPPLSALRDHAGDCDSLGLIYIMLLKRYGIDAILMVSAEYSHSMAAVDIPGQGARFSFGGRQFLVAELTENVSLGQINAAMADPAKWLGIEFKD